MSVQAILSVRHYQQSLVAHSHEHTQLVFGLRGRLDFELQGRGGQIDRERMIVVPAGTHHVCASQTGSDCLVLDVPGECWLAEQLDEQADASRRLLGRPAALRLDSHQQRLVDWLAASPVEDALIARQGAALLLASLNAQGPACREPARLPYAEFDAYIDRHAAHALQVADLARLARLSNARLHARFASEVGLTPMQYIRRRRLQHALHLLRTTGLAIGEVAALVGYGSQSAFSAAMQRAFGHSPLALRREPGDN